MILVVVGGIAAVVLGAPSLGVIVGGAGWLLQRVVQAADRSFTAKLRDPRKQVGINLFESFGRIWLLAAAIIVAGVAGDRQDGLTAAIIIFVAYSFAFGIRIASGQPPERQPS